jgi:hypothetical protein
MTTSTDFEILPALATDVPELLRLVRKLAEYEKLADKLVATEELFREALFGARPCGEALMGL